MQGDICTLLVVFENLFTEVVFLHNCIHADLGSTVETDWCLLHGLESSS